MESIFFWSTTSRALLLGMTLLLPGSTFAQKSSGVSTKSARQKHGFQTRLQKAASLYEALEYEQALAELAQAKMHAETEDERTQIALYEGIILADLGQRPLSLEAFRKALSLNLDAQLPVKVSPKVERDFEDVREDLRSEREATAHAKTQPPQSHSSSRVPSSTSDRPTRLSEESTSSTSVSTQKVSKPPKATPELALGELPLSEKRSHGIRRLTLALLGTGVVAGGVGSYFGHRSRGSIKDAKEAPTGREQLGHLDTAREQALTANILFGVAITSTTGAIIHWLINRDTKQTEATSR